MLAADSESGRTLIALPGVTRALLASYSNCNFASDP